VHQKWGVDKLSSTTRIAAILAAGGVGERFGANGSLSKQFQDLGGKPMYSWSLKTLSDHPAIDQVVLVGRADMHKIIQSQLPQLIASAAQVILVAGGSTRQASVLAGLEALNQQTPHPSHVLIHDAARPFLEKDQLDRFLAVLCERGPCACGMPVYDTIKRTADDVIIGTLDRRGLCAIQTPQGAPFQMLLDAHRQAQQEGVDATDDVALLERKKISVLVVQGSPTNIKITNPEDMPIAEALAARRNVLTK
jgi:2-C-methyl-D-erythritol 4-phosphate cytidylyltransferase / 2-C-methyl-D-erythritol 2,4-cyclodiphosphate synthase